MVVIGEENEEIDREDAVVWVGLDQPKIPMESHRYFAACTFSRGSPLAPLGNYKYTAW